MEEALRAKSLNIIEGIEASNRTLEIGHPTTKTVTAVTAAATICDFLAAHLPATPPLDIPGISAMVKKART